MELETVVCPYCGSAHYSEWSRELSFRAVRCKGCRLIYCNPRPRPEFIDAAVRTGAHTVDGVELNVSARRQSWNVARYRKILSELFREVWVAGRPVKWLDVGAGYGEVVEAVSSLAPAGSLIEGLEPMHCKAEFARRRELRITEGYLHANHDKVNVVSIVNVFSHIPDFRTFLLEVVAVLEPNGELFIETGNLADLEHRHEFPGELGLPDHLVFAGEHHVIGYLTGAGFEVGQIVRERTDGLVNLAKQVAKKVLGRPSQVRVPYVSAYRQLLIRARLNPKLG